MFKKIGIIIKKIIMAAVLLYAYNRFAVSIDAIIPINFLTIIGVSILGIPVIVGLVIFNILFF